MKVTEPSLKNVIKHRLDLFFIHKAAENHSSASKILIELYSLIDQIPDDIEVQEWEVVCTQKNST